MALIPHSSATSCKDQSHSLMLNFIQFKCTGTCSCFKICLGNKLLNPKIMFLQQRGLSMYSMLHVVILLFWVSSGIFLAKWEPYFMFYMLSISLLISDIFHDYWVQYYLVNKGNIHFIMNDTIFFVLKWVFLTICVKCLGPCPVNSILNYSFGKNGLLHDSIIKPYSLCVIIDNLFLN